MSNIFGYNDKEIREILEKGEGGINNEKDVLKSIHKLLYNFFLKKLIMTRITLITTIIMLIMILMSHKKNLDITSGIITNKLVTNKEFDNLFSKRRPFLRQE